MLSICSELTFSANSELLKKQVCDVKKVVQIEIAGRICDEPNKYWNLYESIMGILEQSVEERESI